MQGGIKKWEHKMIINALKVLEKKDNNNTTTR
jgi:hypothetical protein